MEETVKFVDMFNKLFDCLNVGDYVTGKKSRNCFKSPYYTPEDFRLKINCTLQDFNAILHAHSGWKGHSCCTSTPGRKVSIRGKGSPELKRIR